MNFDVIEEMRIVVTVKTRAPEAQVEQVDEGHYKVAVTAAPEKGKANEAVVTALADHFGIAQSAVRIVMGKTHTEKLIDIANIGSNS